MVKNKSIAIIQIRRELSRKQFQKLSYFHNIDPGKDDTWFEKLGLAVAEVSDGLPKAHPDRKKLENLYWIAEWELAAAGRLMSFTRFMSIRKKEFVEQLHRLEYNNCNALKKAMAREGRQSERDNRDFLSRPQHLDIDEFI